MSEDHDLASLDLNFRVSAYDDKAEDNVDPATYVRHLTQAWINERAAPDVLRYEQKAVDKLLEKIEEQTAVVDELDSGDDTAMIVSILYQTELERVKFVLRSYLRARISKPRLDEAVFCRVVEDIGDFQLDEDETVILETGQIYIFRYTTIRVLLQRGQLELI
ncbi:GINS complex subunit [Dissophora globulifera]|nr:GINS complex subunit [Dissophora globulifera]